jgi:hypothetical protein
MAYPTAYTSAVAIPLPSEQVVRQIMGKSYDPERTLNVLKMFAETEDLFEATIGIVKAMFQAKGIDPPDTRDDHPACGKGVECALRGASQRADG